MISLDQRDHPAAYVSEVRITRLGVLTLEVSSKSQRKADTIEIQLPVDSLPSCDKHNRLCRISPRCLNNSIDVLPLVRDSRRLILVALRSDLQATSLQNRLYFIRDPL